MPVISILLDEDGGTYKGVKLVSGQEITSDELVMDPSITITSSPVNPPSKDVLNVFKVGGVSGTGNMHHKELFKAQYIQLFDDKLEESNLFEREKCFQWNTQRFFGLLSLLSNENNRVVLSVAASSEYRLRASCEDSDLKLNGLFFAIGHERATKFLEEQLELDPNGYVVSKPGSTATSVKSVFSADGVQDNNYRAAKLEKFSTDFSSVFKRIVSSALGSSLGMDQEVYCSRRQ
ncbi:NADPH thioredoxin reductase [Artemisia annua]|uniref:NADPH thioredoxin reductase n=1 Tax=Artemisia annua TaxID=35608 RepID=A0A2U1MGT0_ARTAN|nr:NADPH thioredoxin reductase [Artemisia annua]